MLKNIFCTTVIVLASLFSAYSQSTDTAKRQKWLISINTNIGTAFGQHTHFLIKPEISYAYTPHKTISIGFIARDINRGPYYSSFMYQKIAGIRNGVSLAHRWNFSTNKKVGLRWWANMQLWYLQGDLAYAKLNIASDAPPHVYSASALYQLTGVNMEKTLGKNFSMGLGINTGCAFFYGTQIWSRLLLMDAELRINYGF